MVKDPPASAGYIRYVSLFLGQEDSLEESMATYSSIPGEPYGQRSLVGYSPWGKENGIMESECIIVLFVSFLEKKKKSNIPINYVQFTIYLDIPAMNREISSINDKYLVETDII